MLDTTKLANDQRLVDISLQCMDVAKNHSTTAQEAISAYILALSYIYASGVTGTMLRTEGEQTKTSNAIFVQMLVNPMLEILSAATDLDMSLIIKERT